MRWEDDCHQALRNKKTRRSLWGGEPQYYAEVEGAGEGAAMNGWETSRRCQMTLGDRKRGERTRIKG